VIWLKGLIKSPFRGKKKAYIMVLEVLSRKKAGSPEKSKVHAEILYKKGDRDKVVIPDK
jgi:hypothetical protein